MAPVPVENYDGVGKEKPHYDPASVKNIEAEEDIESFDYGQEDIVDDESNSSGETGYDMQQRHAALGIDARVRNKRKNRLCLVGLLVTLVAAGIIAGVSTAAMKRNKSENSGNIEMSIYDMCIIKAEAEYAARNNATCSEQPTDEKYEEGIFTYGTEASVPGEDGGEWTQLADTISGEASGDLSGMALAMSCDGSVIAVGAEMNDSGDEAATGNIGHVRVYRVTETSSTDKSSVWKQIGQDIDGAAANDRFGGAVSLSADGTRVAIGAIHNDASGESSGHVQVYDYEELYEGGKVVGNWVKVGNDIEGEEESEYFGRAVSLSADGTRIAVGSSGADLPTDVGLKDVGKVKVFEFTDNAWMPLGQELHGLGSTDYFGHAVALSGGGSTMAIGGYKNDTGENLDTGLVQVFRYSPIFERWTLIAQDIYGKKSGDWFGLSVALSYDGKRVAVGAPGDDSHFVPGYTAVYEQGSSSEFWMQIGDDLEGGYSVSLSFDGTRVASGSYKGYGNGINAGQVKSYKLLGLQSKWIQVGKDIHGEARSMFGSSVVMSSNGMIIASGAPATLMGAVRVFDLCTSTSM